MVEGGLKVKKKEKPFDAGALLEKLALSSPNDAVKLLFLNEEELAAVEGLDLTLLNEIKRGSNGTVELKFLNKLDIISRLNELKNSERESADGGNSFYAALDKSAKMLGRADGSGV